MGNATRKTGTEALGDAPWGTHFCLFYQAVEDNDVDLDLCVQAFTERSIGNPVTACRDDRRRCGHPRLSPVHSLDSTGRPRYGLHGANEGSRASCAPRSRPAVADSEREREQQHAEKETNV